jgi:hypothetical protein
MLKRVPKVSDMARYHMPRPMQRVGSALRAKIEKRPSPVRRSLWLGLMMLLLPSVLHAGGGFLGIDSELPLDTGGIWARKYQTGIENGVIAVEVAGALWFGNALIKATTRMHGSREIAAKAFRAAR